MTRRGANKRPQRGEQPREHIKARRGETTRHGTEAEWVSKGMLEPVANPNPGGYVPLCAALPWIITDRGTRAVAMDDETAWKSGVDELFPLIHTGEVELTGLPSSKPLARQLLGTALALVRVLPPLSSEIPYLNSP